MKKVSLFILACLMLSFLAGCSSKSDKFSEIQKKGKMVVYVDPNFAPFEFSGKGGIQGVDIEIARAIGKELGVSVIFKEAKFDSILMAIKGGKGDISISGFTITEERKESVDFSIPYIKSVQYLILPKGSDVAFMEDLAGLKLGVAKDYTGQFLLEDETGKDGVLYGKNTEIREYNSCMEAVLDLKAGRINAVVMDEYVAKNAVSKNEGLEAKELCYQSGDLAYEEYGVVIPKGNEKLVEKINAVIQKLINEDKIREWVVKFSE